MTKPVHSTAESNGPRSKGESALTSALRWMGLLLMIAPLFVRASSTLDLFPGWDTDPLSVPQFRGGLTPAGSIGCDAVSLLGSGLLLLFARSIGSRPRLGTLALAAIGAAGVAVHVVGIGPGLGSIGDQRVGLAWLSGILAGVALVHAGSDARVRRVGIASVLGFTVLLAVRGGHEMLIDHPRTVAEFNRDRDRILASRGWAPESSMAKSFERRLLQSDVSGWFGLSNVYAALLAAGATMGGGIAFAWARRRSRGQGGDASGTVPGVLIGAGAAACVAGVAMAQSKGGVAALGVGIGSFVLLSRVKSRRTQALEERPARLAGFLGVAAVAGALGLVIARGLIGERIGELSIYFRWFYAQAALRIFAQHPGLGVGPDGFQRAYLLAKSPISPEEVSSPHSILLDYIATLGVSGAAFGVLLLVWAWRAGSCVARGSADTDGITGGRDETRTALGIAALSTLTASHLQGALVTPDLAVVRVAGLVAWSAIAWGVLRAMRSGIDTRAAVASGALALLAHAQIDVGLSWTQSCGIALCVIALAAAPTKTEPPGEDRPPSHRPALTVAAFACLAACIGVGAGAVPRAVRWERALVKGADEARLPAEFRERLSESLAGARPERAGGKAGESSEEVLRALGQAVGRRVSADRDDIRLAMIEIETRVIPLAIPGLVRAAELDPADFRPRREAARLWVRLADAQRALGRESAARGSLDEALRTAQAPSASATSAQHALIAQVRERRAQAFDDTRELSEAAKEVERACGQDPYNLDLALRRYRLAAALKEPLQAWASRCLRLDDLTRLDRAVRGLPPTVREELAEAAEKP